MPEAKEAVCSESPFTAKPPSSPVFGELFPHGFNTECFQNAQACICRTVRHREPFPLIFREPCEKVAKQKTLALLLVAD